MKLQRYSLHDVDIMDFILMHGAILCKDDDVEALEAENAALHAECDRLTAMMGTGSLSEKKMNHAFLGGVCVALQAITAMDNGVLWSDIVSACGPEKISHYAKTIEPDEWEIAGFSKYYKDEVAK